jgi:archaetidylserine synthase
MSKKHLIKELSVADYVTSISILLIVNAFWLAWNNQIHLAIAVTFISMFLDYLDGKLARKYGGSPYGKVLDSLYDILGWVLFPALMVNVQSGWAWWSLIITSTYCLFSALRLSRFTVAGYVETSKRYYTGSLCCRSKNIGHHASSNDPSHGVLTFIQKIPTVLDAN